MTTYHQRADLCENPVSKQLLQLMQQKKTNLAISADVTQKEDLIRLADTLGPKICLLKTHIDIIEDFDPALTDALSQLAEKHQFLIFEDRKFADIGSTVQKQYAQGIYRIADWAHITNAHTVPGPGIIRGLKSVGLEKNRALLLLAEMSSEGTLAKDQYTQATIEMAEDHPDFVIGFISTNKLVANPTFLHLTPGVHLEASGDPLGQQYISPREAILERGNDVIIVGRGIFQSENPLETAEAYRAAGWSAYEERCELFKK